jgi:hypothetical protein
MWWVLLLVAVLLPVAFLLGLVAASTLGLEADQAQVKKSYRWLGALAVAYGLGADSWFYILCGCICLLISHPKINLPGIARRVDKALGDGADHPARYIP